MCSLALGSHRGKFSTAGHTRLECSATEQVAYICSMFSHGRLDESLLFLLKAAPIDSIMSLLSEYTVLSLAQSRGYMIGVLSEYTVLSLHGFLILNAAHQGISHYTSPFRKKDLKPTE